MHSAHASACAGNAARAGWQPMELYESRANPIAFVKGNALCQPKWTGPVSDRPLGSVLAPHELSELYRLMVEGVRECVVFLLDTDGFITVWNKAAEEMKGYPAAEAIGQHLSMLYTDEDRHQGAPQHHLALAKEAGFFRGEGWRMRKDRSLFFANVTITALRDDAGTLRGFSKITLDLTAHKLLERCEKERAEIDMVLQAAHSGTWRWNVGTGVVHLAAHFLALLGRSGVDSPIRFDEWIGMFHPQDQDLVRARLLAACETAPASHFEDQVRLCTAGDTHRWFHVHANWNETAGGAPLILMGVCVDVHTLKTAEAAREHANQQLHAERARFSHIMDHLPSGVLLADVPSGHITYQNREAGRMLGRDLPQTGCAINHEDYRFFDAGGMRIAPADLPLARTILTNAGTQSEELVYERPDGVRAHYAVTTASIFDTDGARRLAIAVMHDVSALKTAQLSAATEKEQAQVTLSAITDGVITTDLNGIIALVNPVAERMTGWTRQEAVGHSIDEVVRPFDNNCCGETVTALIRRCLDEGRVLQGLPHAMLSARGGQRYTIESAIAPIALADGKLIGSVLVFHDVTESRRMLDQLGYEASHDALTGLVNRREFEVRLKRTLERIKLAPDSGAALLYMDLDQFKIVNDTCGHAAGDDLLHILAQVYRGHVRERDTLARLGGDEFALIVDHCTVEEAMMVAEKILDATARFRYACKDRMFHLGVSIGLIPIDDTAASVEEALRQADHACYIAKETGRNRIHLHQRDDAKLIMRRSDMNWVTRLTNAIECDGLQLHYQPIMPIGAGDTGDTGDTGVTGLHYEILLRLKNGSDGVIKPGMFLPAAERYDVMPHVDRWVLRKSLEWLGANPDHVAALSMCSINLSRRTLADATFQHYAADLIDNMGVPPEKLCFEITENGAITNMQRTISFIEALSGRGCRFSLDDFGTGMTSFAYLKQLPVDYIKIDGSLIQMMASSKIDYEMVRFTNDISHMMGRQTIAEYVTDETLFNLLREIRVDFVQGYYVGAPRLLELPA